MKEDLKKLETLSYRPAKSSPATLGMNSAVIKPGKWVNKAEDAGQPIEPLKFPEMCENTLKIVKACKLVVQAAEDHDTDTMTTPITVVQACEQLSHLITRVKKVARAKEQREADNAMVEGLNYEEILVT